MKPFRFLNVHEQTTAPVRTVSVPYRVRTAGEGCEPVPITKL